MEHHLHWYVAKTSFDSASDTLSSPPTPRSSSFSGRGNLRPSLSASSWDAIPANRDPGQCCQVLTIAWGAIRMMLLPDLIARTASLDKVRQ